MVIQVNPTLNPRIITIPGADGDSITVQSLVNQIRAWEADQTNICYPRLLSASGKEVLDTQTLVGITAKLENAKVKFEDRNPPTIVCNIYGGNLVAVDAYGEPINPIEASANVTVTKTSSSSATLIQAPILEELEVQVGEMQYQVAAIQEAVEDIHPELIEQHGSGSWEKAMIFEEE